MQFLLDTANLGDVRKYVDLLPISGVTSNPSIVIKEGSIDFWAHMNEIRNIIGKDRTLHIQVVGTTYDEMMQDAKAIINRVDQAVYIKVPVNLTGMKVIKQLKAEGYNVTATAIYTKIQAYLAIEAGADYLAPYYNRMENLNINAQEVIQGIAQAIARTNSNSKILGASFRNIEQVNTLFEQGGQAATIGADLIEEAFAMPSIYQAVEDFTTDWEKIFPQGSTLETLE